MSKRANGEGSVFFDERAKRFKALTAGPLRKSFSGKTQAEAIRRRAEYQKHHGNIAHTSARQPLAEYLRAWLSTKAVSDRTADGYKVTIERHIIPTLGTVRLDHLKPQHVQRALDVARSPWTRLKVYQLLNAALELAVTWDVIPKNPCRKVTAPPTPDAPAVPLDEEAFYTFLDIIKADRLHALWLLLVACGPRRGEAIALSRSNVNLEAGTVTFVRSLQRVRGKLVFLPAKTKKGNRTVSLPPQVVAALRAHLEKDETGSDLVFSTRYGTPLEPRNVTRRFHQLLDNAKIPPTKLHALRHTAASILLRENADLYAVQAMLGHARATTTVEVYGHLMSGPNVTADKMSAVLTRKPKRP